MCFQWTQKATDMLTQRCQQPTKTVAGLIQVQVNIKVLMTRMYSTAFHDVILDLVHKWIV